MKKKILRLSRYLFGLLLALGLAGCEKPIDVKPPAYQSKLVIEGTIENGKPAMVILSKSIPYFSNIDFAYITDSVMITGADAVVTVTSDAGETEQLTWQPCTDSPLYFAFLSNKLTGRENTSYTLTVEYKGHTYTAVTTIPHTFELDSIRFDHSLELLNDSMRTIRVFMTDNPYEKNYYAFSVKIKCPAFQDRLWVPSLPIVFDDQTFNGLAFNYEVTRASPSGFLLPEMSSEEKKEYYRLTFRPGDTVLVKHSLMDYNTYRFMITGGAEAVYGSNPFTNPAPIISNIQGDDVLGNWSGFASSIDTLIWFTDKGR